MGRATRSDDPQCQPFLFLSIGVEWTDRLEIEGAQARSVVSEAWRVRERESQTVDTERSSLTQ